MNKSHRDFGVHNSHCWQNDHADCCKYGDEDCQAMPDVWPHRTYDENYDDVVVTKSLEIIKVSTIQEILDSGVL